jgi:hypothetical protein
LLERPAQPEQAAEPESPAESIEAEPAGKGRGEAPKKSKAAELAALRAARKREGRTVYIPDELYERIIVQAKRRKKTMSEYVVAILDRQVPDHRVVRGKASETDAA